MRKIILISVAIFLYLAAYGVTHWRQVKDKKRAFETGNVVKPPDEGYKKETGGYNEDSAKHHR